MYKGSLDERYTDYVSLYHILRAPMAQKRFYVANAIQQLVLNQQVILSRYSNLQYDQCLKMRQKR